MTKERTATYFSFFWLQQAPHVVRHTIEKRSMMLLDLIPDKAPLTYAGEDESWWLRGRLELRFEAADLNGILYSLRYDARADKKHFTEAKFKEDSQRAFQHWLRDYQLAQDPRIAMATGDRYEQLVKTALEFEAKRAATKEDENAIEQAKDAVLDRLRKGKRFVRADHEGITYIGLKDDVLWRTRVGEDPSEESFTGRDEILKFLRSYFDWEARRDTAPHKPPEAEIWKLIGRKFE